MRPGSLLINTARGGLIVEADLRDSLVSGHLAGAGLDVLNHEPPEPGNPLLGLPNVVFEPPYRRYRPPVDERHGRAGRADHRRAVPQSVASGCVVNGDVRQGWRW